MWPDLHSSPNVCSIFPRTLILWQALDWGMLIELTESFVSIERKWKRKFHLVVTTVPNKTSKLIQLWPPNYVGKSVNPIWRKIQACSKITGRNVVDPKYQLIRGCQMQNAAWKLNSLLMANEHHSETNQCSPTTSITFCYYVVRYKSTTIYIFVQV